MSSGERAHLLRAQLLLCQLGADETESLPGPAVPLVYPT